MPSLIWSLLRNLGSGQLNRDKVGYSIEKQFEAIGYSEARAYAEAIKDGSPFLDGPNGFVTPFYPSRLLSSMAKEIITLKGLNLNLLKMVHGEQHVLWHHPVKVGDRLKYCLVIERIKETPAGELMTLLGKGFKDGLLMNEVRMGFLVRSNTTSRAKKPMKTDGRERFRIPLQTDHGQQLTYARASGDNNFIHTNEFLARMAGLSRTIMQGICVMAMTCSRLSEKLIESDPSRLISIKGRFAEIVLPGQRLDVIGYAGDTPSEIRFEVLNPAGKRVIRNGVFEFRTG